MNPACVLRLWRGKSVRLFLPFSRDYAEVQLAFYVERGWQGIIEEILSCN